MRTFVVLSFVAAFACTTAQPLSDEPEQIWSCACAASCDGVTVTIELAVCADSDSVADAIAESAEDCAARLDHQCSAHGACACQCNPSGVGC